MLRVSMLLATLTLVALTLATAQAQDNKNNISVSFGNSTKKTIMVYKVDAATKKEVLMKDGELKSKSSAGGLNNARDGDVIRVKFDGKQLFDYKLEPGFAEQTITVDIVNYTVQRSKKAGGAEDSVVLGDAFPREITEVLKGG